MPLDSVISFWFIGVPILVIGVVLYMYQIRIFSFHRTTSFLGPVYFHISVSGPTGTWKVYRRYSDFVQLAQAIALLYPKIVLYFPSGSILSRFMGDSYYRSRASQLETFLNRVLAIEPNPRAVVFRNFLGIDAPYMSLPIMGDFGSSQLCPDSIVCVLSYLEACEVLSLSRLSKAWHAATQSSDLWQKVSIRSLEYEKIQFGFLSFLTFATAIVELHLEFQAKHEMRFCVPGDVIFPCLKTLSLKGKCEPLYQELLDVVVSSNECLEGLYITGTLQTVEFAKTIASVCRVRPVRDLRISSTWSHSVEIAGIFFQIFQENTRFTRFCVSGIAPSLFAEAVVLSPASAPQLEAFTYTLLPVKFVASQWPETLRHLEIFLTPVVDLVSFFRGFPKNLETLHLSISSVGGPVFLDESFPSFLHLASLHLVGEGFSRLVGQFDFSRLFPAIRHVRLHGCVEAIGEPQVEAMLRNGMETIDIEGRNEKLTDTILCRIARGEFGRRFPKEFFLPKTEHMSSIGREAISQAKVSLTLVPPGGHVSSFPPITANGGGLFTRF